MRRGGCPKEGLKRGAWTSEEDKMLSDYIKAHGLGRWRSLPANAGLNRCGKSCRLRWLNYLRPDIKLGNITEEEEDLIVRLHKLLGNRWSLIAGRLPGRTDNEIKNYWNTYLRKKVTGENSENQSSSRAKKVSIEKPILQKDEKSVDNVMQTKPVLCTRPLLTNQIPNPSMNNASDAPIPTTSSTCNFILDFNEQSSYPPSDTNNDRIWITELMQNSFFPQASNDSSYTSTNVEICSNDHSYLRGLLDSSNKEGQGPYSFLDPRSWESFVNAPQKTYDGLV